MASVPTYETDEDLAREAQIANIIAKAWDVELCKFSPTYRLDYSVHDHTASCVGFLEIRHRNISSMDYPTFMMSASKAEAARLWGDLGVPVAMVVKMSDGLFIFDPRFPDYEEEGGRASPRDPFDRGIMAHFSMARLKHFTRDSRLTYTMPHSPIRPKYLR
jgi:hypothetical protein